MITSTIPSRITESEKTTRANALSDAEHRLQQHRLDEPVDSKFEVFLYQDAKAQRDAWDATLPELEARVQTAKASVQDWDEKTKDGWYEKNLVWEKFSSKAPDQAQVNKMVIAADSKRVNFSEALSIITSLKNRLNHRLLVMIKRRQK